MASVAWDHFTNVKLAEPGRPIPALAFGWCVTCTPFDAETLKVIADASAAGTSHETLAGTYKQLIVCKPSSGTGNLKGHIKSHHAAVFETLWGDPPKAGQGSIVLFLTAGWCAVPPSTYLHIFNFNLISLGRRPSTHRTNPEPTAA